MRYIKNFPKIDVVILAGGKGTRIKKFLNGKPKPLINFGKKPFLDYVIKKISSYPINKIYIMCGYKGNKIYKKYNKTFQNFVPISCVIEKEPLGTGGSLKLIADRLSKNFILINGDTFFDIDYSFFFNSKKKKRNLIILSKNNSYKANKKLVSLNIDINEKVKFDKNSKYFNGGIYFFNKSIIKKINKIKKQNISLENDIIKDEIFKGKIFGKFKKNFFLDIGTKENLFKGIKMIPKITMKPAAFFDRDGVINFDRGYTYKIKDFKFMPKILNILKEISKKEFYIFIVTNQASIAHGVFSEKKFILLQKNLKIFLFKKNILIHDVKYCPFHKKALIKKYKKNTAYRKPGNLMVENLKKNWNINIKKSFMVGDKSSDEKCANKSGIKFFYPYARFDRFTKNL